MTETTEQTNERRARAIEFAITKQLIADNPYGATARRFDDLSPHDRAKVLNVMEAIRASDEAAGMVLVPRNATLDMVVAVLKAYDEKRPLDIWEDVLAACEKSQEK